MDLYVIRHGQTAWNALKKIQGAADIPLNEHGIRQAHQTNQTLENTKIDFIFSSPLERAKQTAQIIGEGRACSIVIDERLKERNYGEFEGVNKSSFGYDDFWAYRKNLSYISAENVQDFFKRVYGFLDELKQKYPDKAVLVVCHAGVVKAIECYANGMMEDEKIGQFVPENASVLQYCL